MTIGPVDLRHSIIQRLSFGVLPRALTSTSDPAAPIPAVTVHPQNPTSVAMLVAIAASDPKVKRQRLTADADKGLRALETLHDDLRLGRSSRARINAIAAWMDDHSVPEDPAAAELMREVELRVLVELAKANYEK